MAKIESAYPPSKTGWATALKDKAKPAAHRSVFLDTRDLLASPQ